MRGKMKPIMRRMWLPAILLALSLLFSGCFGKSLSLRSDYVFKVGSEKCSVEEAKIILLQYQKEYASVYGIDLWSSSGEAREDLEAYVKNLTVSQLAEVYTLTVIAGEQEVELTDEEKEETRAAAEEFYASLSAAELEYLEVSVSDIDALYQRFLLADKLYAALTANVVTEVSDSEAQVMEVKQIVLSDADSAQKMYEKLESGTEFSALAASYSESETIDLQVSRTTYSTAVTQELFSLDEGEYTGVIQIGDLYYLFYCSNYFNEELTQENKANVIAQRMEDAVNNTYTAYVDKLDSVLNDKIWDEVEVDTSLSLSGATFGEIYEAYFGE